VPSTLNGNHASEKVSRKLGYTGNEQHLVHREDTGRTTEYQLRLDRQTCQYNRRGAPCVITGLARTLVMFGLDGEHDQRPRGYRRRAAHVRQFRPAQARHEMRPADITSASTAIR
jgi:hypothetical protein